MFFAFFSFFFYPDFVRSVEERQVLSSSMNTTEIILLSVFLPVFCILFFGMITCFIGPRCCYTNCPCCTKCPCWNSANDPSKDPPAQYNKDGVELPQTTGKLYGSVRPLGPQAPNPAPVNGPTAVYPVPGYPQQQPMPQTVEPGFEPPPMAPPGQNQYMPPPSPMNQQIPLPNDNPYSSV